MIDLIYKLIVLIDDECDAFVKIGVGRCADCGVGFCFVFGIGFLILN